jgi:Flp pilus assembly protein TadG
MERRVTKSWKRLLNSFRHDSSGTIAVIFGLSAIPIAIAASIAVDMANSSEIKSQLQAAVDTAVLAAATRMAGNASDGDKEEIAVTTFYANLSPQVQAQLQSSPSVDVDFPTKTVSMTVAVNTNPVFGTLVTDDISISVSAAATVSPGTPVCMMALNKNKEKSINIQGTTDIIADGCAVHVNSSHPQKALYQTGSSTAEAESFCVQGGYEGTNFTPMPHGCYYEEDPIAAKFAEDWEASGIDSMPCDYTDLPQINTGAGEITNLAPGVYCGGLSIKQGTVQLETGGMYVFRDGPLDVQAHGTLLGDEVVILFTGDDTTRLVTQAGADIITSARSGENDLFRGLAFAQDPDCVPASENLVIGGGEITIDGIMYFPTQPLKLTGNGEIGTNAAQFAIIADTVSIEGNGQLKIKIGQNYASTGLPDLPESQEVVYLLE